MAYNRERYNRRALPHLQSDWQSSVSALLAHLSTEFANIQRAIPPALVVDLRDFGWSGNGRHSDLTPLRNALREAQSSQARRVYIPAGTTVIDGALSLGSAYAGVKIVGDGAAATTILKAFDGTLLTLDSVLNFEMHGLKIDGNYGTNTGKGVVMTGTSNSPVIAFCEFIGLSDAHVRFGPDAGYNGRFVANRHFTGVGQSDFLTYHCAGQDTTATPRVFSACFSNGYFKFEGAYDTLIGSCFATRYEVDNNCSIANIAGSTWADQVNYLANIPITIGGQHTQVTGCRIANSIVLANGSSGALTGNKQSGVIAGTEPVDDQSGGTWQVLHQALGKNYTYIGRSKLGSFVQGEIQTYNAVSPGDTDVSISFHSNNVLGYHTPLTANRSLTLDLTDARAGQTINVHRDGGDTLGPWTVALGATGRTLANNEWYDLLYNGSYVEVMRKGTL